MEDFYEKYLDKEHIINQACNCIEGNSSSKLKDEITQIKNTINGLSLQESWQDSIGDAFENVKTSFSNTLSTIESSISNDFRNSERIYMKLKVDLQRLKTTNDLYQKEYLKKPKNVNDSDYESELDKWKRKVKKLKNNCINLCDEIDIGFSELNNINSINIAVDLSSIANSIGNFVGIVGGMGTFLAGDVFGQYGTIISGTDGREYTIYNQGEINGWRGFCNRASAASIASAFALDGQDPLQEANNVSKYNPQIGYDQNATSDYFARFGCRAKVNKVNCSYDNVSGDIVSALRNGDKVMFDLSESNVYGASGHKWTSERHWVAALDIKTVKGKDYIFISDSAHDGSLKDYYGVGEGWYPVDEFAGKKIANVTVVSPPAKPVVSTNATVSGSQTTVHDNNNGYVMNSSQTVSGTDIEAAVYQAVKDEGYNDAVAAALLANVDAESNFDASASGDRGSSYGLYQWHNNRKSDFLQYCENNNLDSTDPYVQTKYALYEVENNPQYKRVYDTLTSVPDTRDGYIEASKRWTTDFEVPTNKNAKANSRAINGEKYYTNIVQFNSNSNENV